jgi:predicted transcriptional regulator
MVKPGPTTKMKKLLLLWKDKETEVLLFSEILKVAKEKLNIGKRTIINYLNALVEQEILEKTVDQKRNTFYKLMKPLELERTFLKEQIDTMKEKEMTRLLDFYSFELMLNMIEQQKKKLPLNYSELVKIMEKTKSHILETKRLQRNIEEALKEKAPKEKH